MRPAALILTAALLGLAFAPAPFGKKAKPAAQSLEGVWEQVGRPVPAAGPGKKGGVPVMAGPATIIIGGGKWVFQRHLAVRNPGAPLPRRTEYFLKADANATPPRFDLMKGSAEAAPYGRGIYKLDGDRLEIAYSWSADRPRGFDAAPRVFIMTLKRSAARAEGSRK